MSELQEGATAPAIEVATDKGETFRLGDLKGKTVVLYFYPKADTPGCTKESCEFRDAMADLAGLNAVVVGASPDTPEAQTKFKQKYHLPFTLLADEQHKVAEDYGVWKEKTNYGKKYMGIERTTFLIGPDGVIRKIFRKVKPEGHAAEVQTALSSL
jgi:peroxiredoxin Q/BCP